jgi:hypothetical protein
MAQPAANTQTGRLRGEPPDFFNGDRTKTETFKRQFRMYKGLNSDHEIMQSPYLRTMLALSLIKGPLVEDWAADQVELLEQKVTRQVNPLPMTDPTLWTDFETALDANFSNIAQKQHAMNALYHLRMQKDRFDDYVSTFKHYAKQAEFDLTHPATVQLFVMGIESNLQNAILHRDNQPTTIDEYIRDAHIEIRKYRHRQAIKNPGSAKFQWIGSAQQPKLQRQQRYTHPNDQVVPMDVDPPVFTQVRRANTEAEKQDYKARGACFRCNKQGHMARDCPTRKEQPFKPSFQRNWQSPPSQPRPQSGKPSFKKKTFGQKRPQGFRKFNKPFAYNYVQQARAATIEEVEEEEDDSEEYEQEEIADLAARTTRLSDVQRESLLHEMANANPNF